MDEGYEVDPETLREAATDLARRTRDCAEQRASVRWPGVEECGSPAGADALGEVADWYLATWARVESGLTWLADSAAVTADDYAATERTVTDGTTRALTDWWVV